MNLDSSALPSDSTNPELSVVTPSTFIRVTEIWRPSESKGGLVLTDGAYGELQQLKEATSEIVFGYGEGLPGLAWQERKPQILKSFENSVFARKEIAQSLGITSAVALPIFSGTEVHAVILFLCGNSCPLSGALEVWQEDELGVLVWSEGYYGDLTKFEALSKSIQFQKGTGLPGIVWQNQYPLLIPDISKDGTSFLRSKYAGEVGLKGGVGIPIFGQSGGLTNVLTFLSSESTPIADRFEVWKPSATNEGYLEFDTAIEKGAIATEPVGPEKRLPKGTNTTIGSAWEYGIPIIAEGERADGHRSLLTFPVIQGDQLNSVIACYNR